VNLHGGMTMSTIDYRAIYDQVEQEFACSHERTEYRRKVASNGTVALREQCIDCGRLVRVVPKAEVGSLREYIDQLPEFDDDLASAWWKQKHQAVQERVALAQEQEHAEWRSWYDDYLASTDWQRRRALVLARAGHLCEGCRSAQAEQVHHLTYERVGHEMLFDLVAVCRRCHRALHPAKDEQAV
jgi:hypothetical protein